MKLAPSSQPATVYHSGRRRYLTLDAACRDMVKQLFDRRCECDHGDAVTPAYTCPMHEDWNSIESRQRRARLAGWFRRRYRKSTLPKGTI